LQTSPRPKIFLYFLCYKVSGSTSKRKLDSFVANPDWTKGSWGLLGTKEYKLLYGLVDLCLVLTSSNTAVYSSLLISTNFFPYSTLIPLVFNLSLIN